MPYLKDCLQRTRRLIKFVTETSPQEWLDEVATDHVYGRRDGSDLAHHSSMADFDTVEKWSEAEWQQWFRKWIVDANSSTLLAKPSQTLSEKLEKDEQARVTKQKEELGEKKLKELAERLEEAKKENDQEIPKELLRKYPIPAAESIRFIDTDTARAGLARKVARSDSEIQKRIDADDSKLPLYLHFEHVKSNFVTLGLIMNTHDVPEKLRPLIPLYATNFFNTPVMRNGERMEYEDVVAHLEKHMVSSFMTTSDANEQLFRFGFQVEPEMYGTAIEWLSIMLFDSIFDQTRLLSGLKKLIASLVSEKRAGEDVVVNLGGMVHTTRENIGRSSNTLIRGPHLKRMLTQLQNEPESLISDLKKLQQALAYSPSFRCYALGNFETDRIPHPVKDWSVLTKRLGNSRQELEPLDSVRSSLSPKGKEPGEVALIMPLRTMDSSFMYLYGKGIHSHQDPMLPALTVAQAYLEVIEGPLWNAIRGTGLAYGTYFKRSLQRGALTYYIYRSPDAFKAFNVSKELVADLVSGKTELDELRIEDAISNIIKGVANEGPSMQAAASMSFMNQVILDVPKDWSRRFAKGVQHVTKTDILQALREFILPLFDPKSANAYVTCAPVMEEKLLQDLKQAGFPAESKQWSDFKDDYGLDMGGVDDEDLEDELDDDEMDEVDDEGEDEEAA